MRGVPRVGLRLALEGKQEAGKDLWLWLCECDTEREHRCRLGATKSGKGTQSCHIQQIKIPDPGRNFEFQMNNKSCFNLCPMQYWGHTDTKNYSLSEIQI